jgi:thiol-disulfide isomerase/thioredoxin
MHTLLKSSIFVLLWGYSTSCFSQDVKVIKFQDLSSLIESSTDSVLVINFWATWCKPCVKELPCFYELDRAKSSSGIRTVLVSLDFKKQLETTLKPFLTKRGSGPEAFLLDEPDYDSWINKISADWSGAIPATLLVNPLSGTKHFHEGEFTCDELNQLVNTIKNR